MITPADSEYHNVRARRSLRLANTNTHTHTHTHTHTGPSVYVLFFVFFSVRKMTHLKSHVQFGVTRVEDFKEEEKNICHAVKCLGH